MNHVMARLIVFGLVLLVIVLVSGASVSASGDNELTPLDIPEDRGAMGLAYDGARHEVVMFGGCCDDSGIRLGDTWTWTPNNGWVHEFPANFPGCRNSSRMAYDAARQEIVLFGGVGFNTGCTGTATRQNDTWTWNGSNWTQETTTNRPGIRASMGLAYDPRSGGTVVLFGGNGDCGPPGGTEGTCNDAWVWDGSTWTQCLEGVGEACETRPPVRSSPAMAFHTERGTMLVAGGHGSPMLLDDTWSWLGINLGWNDLTGSVGGFGERTGHRVAYDSVKKAIVLFGGCVPNCTFDFGEGPDTPDDTVNDTWTLDGGAWTMKTPSAPPSSRCCGGMAFVDFGFSHVVVFQGQDEANPWGLPGVWYWKWQGSNGQWIACTGTNEACT